MEPMGMPHAHSRNDKGDYRSLDVFSPAKLCLRHEPSARSDCYRRKFGSLTSNATPQGFLL